MDPKQIYWYKNYVLFPNLESPAFQVTFRRRIRLPHHSFLSLLKKVSTSPLFQRWDLNKMRHHINQTSSLSLLLLGTLRYLGRGWNFDDLEESTGIRHTDWYLKTHL